MRSGKAWPVLAGQICRIVVVEGAQVADFNAWNLNNPRERFWAAYQNMRLRSTIQRQWDELDVAIDEIHRRHSKEEGSA